ncbi:MAG TPA: AAA family ATPase, partial [Steroidobacteraceae bacterium]
MGTPQRIVVLNPKGGSGKTTIAINLASYYATRQQVPVLMDYDPQGSSLRWVKKRQPAQPVIHSIAAFENDSRTTRAFQLRVPGGTTHVIVDTPAAVGAARLPDIT